MLGFSLALRYLILVVQSGRDRVVAVVRLVAKPVERSECQRVDPIYVIVATVAGGDEAQSRSQVQQDIGCLIDDEVAVFEDWWRADRQVDAIVGDFAVDVCENLLDPVLDLGGVCVLGPSLF